MTKRKLNLLIQGLALIAAALLVFIVTISQAEDTVVDTPNVPTEFSEDEVDGLDLPTEVIPAPGLLCGVGDTQAAPAGGPAGCSPVNDWWCDEETACMGYAVLPVAEVIAPKRFSGLNPQENQEWYRLYDACALGYYQERDRADRLQRELDALKPTPPPSTGCDDFVDGAGGRVWKPVADSGGRVVFLMERGFPERNPIVTGATVTSQSLTNGDRPTFRLDKYYWELPSPVIVQFQSICLEVPNPSKRYD